MAASTEKDALREFYAAESRDRATEAWLREGGRARVPENPASHYFLDRKVETAVALAGLRPDAHVLEVGSSWGHQSFLLAERFARVTAVDLSPESIALARRRAAHYGVANVAFETGDAEDLAAFDDASFDGVLCFSTLRFCPNPMRALAEMFRTVKPGGPVVVDVPNAACPWYGPVKRGLGIEAHIHDRLFTASEAQQLMTAAGFDDVEVKSILFTSKRVPAALLPAFRLFDRVGERAPIVRGLAGILMVKGTRGVRR